jgi:hypothetical protein
MHLCIEKHNGMDLIKKTRSSGYQRGPVALLPAKNAGVHWTGGSLLPRAGLVGFYE